MLDVYVSQIMLYWDKPSGAFLILWDLHIHEVIDKIFISIYFSNLYLLIEKHYVRLPDFVRR